jgi:hypothetical protein
MQLPAFHSEYNELGFTLIGRYIPLTQHFDYIIYLDSVSRRLGYEVVQFVDVLRYKPKSCGFDSRLSN